MTQKTTYSPRTGVDTDGESGTPESLASRRAHASLRVSIVLLAAATVGLVSFGCSRSPEAAKQAYFESGNRYQGEGKYREAVIEYRNAIQLDARFSAARLALARAYDKLGEPQNALSEYVRVADLLPDDDAAQLRAGNYLLAARQFEDARTRAEGILARNGRNAAAQVLLGNALAGLKNIDGAVSEIEEAIRLDPLRAPIYTNLGMLEMSRGRAAAAEAAFKRSVELDPAWAPGHTALANHYWATGRIAEAEVALKRAEALAPKDPAITRLMVIFLLMTGRAKEAEHYARTLAESGAPFALADVYSLQNRPGDAIEILQQLRTREGLSEQATRRLAYAYAIKGEFVRAHEAVDELLKRRPRDAESLLLKGQLLATDGKPDAALQLLQAAAQVDPASARLQYALGRLHSSRGDTDAARQAYTEALRLNPRATASKIELARLALATGQAESSVQYAQEAAQSQPASLRAQLMLVRSQIATADIVGAEKLLADLLARYPDEADVHVQRAVALAARRNLPAARQSFERALVLQPQNAEALSGLFALDCASGSVPEGRARISKALQVQPDRPDLLLIAARAAAVAKDFTAAEAHLRHAVDRDPAFLPAYVMLGQLYFTQKRLDDARREFRVLAERQTKPVAALTMLGMIAQIQGDAASARDCFERALEANPRAPIAANNLAWIYADRGEQLDTALRHAKLAVEAMPTVADAHDTLGWVYYKMGMPDLAVAAFKEASRLSPRSPDFAYRLGLSSAQAGDPAAARQALRRALELDPSFRNAADAKRLLSELGSSPSQSYR